MEVQVDGETVFAATGGQPFDSAKPAILFVHGAGMDRSVWGLMARWFAHNGRSVAALDLPGHGRSGGAPLASVEAIGDWLIRAAKALGVDRPGLCGHSMGAAAALEAAATLGDRCRGLALLGAAPAIPVHPKMLASAQTDGRDAIAMMCLFAHSQSGKLGASPTPGVATVGGAHRVLTRGAAMLRADLPACDAWSGESAAARIACPSVVVVGARDRMTPPKAGRALAAAIPNTQLIELPKIGHMMIAEAPDGARRAVQLAL